MKLKRLLSGFLVAATLFSLPAALPAAGAAGSIPASFTDISDPDQADAAEILRLLGIVSGDENGNFRPSGTLTRAEFCKMAIELMGRGDEAVSQQNRTIYNDVKADHWARGYVNLASAISLGADAEGKGGDKLMIGVGDGNFYPNRTITYAEAVTILMRILGYTAKDVASGGAWYAGYLAAAGTVKLTDGVSLSADSTITRGQTAVLFQNLLFTNPKDAKDPYLTSLEGKITKESILLSVDATAEDGTTGAIRVIGDDGAASTYKTDHIPFPASLEGYRAKLVLDKDDKVLDIQPSDTGSARTVTVVRSEATYLAISSGEKLDVKYETIVYKDGEKKTYKDLYLGMKSGDQVTFHYAESGKLEYLFIPTAETVETAAVARTVGEGNPFSSLVGSATGYRVLKNGVEATTGDIRQYDVATYDKATKTLSVSDLRLTGVYENVAPSPATPLRVTVLGATFPVLSSAYGDLSSFKIGDVVTLLLTADGQVAGAVSPEAAKSTTVGTVTSIDKDGYAQVTPLIELKDPDGKAMILKGRVSQRNASATKLQGQLVTVSSSKVDQIALSRLTNSGATGTMDVMGRKVGDTPLADNVRLYERVGNGQPVEIKFSQLTRATVPADQIAYVGLDYAGKVNLLVLTDVTGDQYTYGFAKKGTMGTYDPDYPMSYSNPTVTVTYGNGASDNIKLVGGGTIKDKEIIGIAASLDEIDGTPKLASSVTLTAVEDVPRTAFQVDVDTPIKEEDSKSGPDLAPIGTVTVNGLSIPIAGNVVCYNSSTEKFFDSLNDARAYSDTLTVYYDRTPAEGGKVRLITVE